MSPWLLSPDEFLNPQISIHTHHFIRIAGGLLMFGTLLWTLPHRWRFFISERWNGYGESSPEVDLIQNPFVYPFVMALWMGSTLCLVAGWYSVAAAFVNLVFCRYFFVRMRWGGILRGMGAPGAMSWWLAVGMFLLEYTNRYAPELKSLALLVMQVDFALIMFSAGFYKFTAGYPQNEGFQLGLVNPQWSYWTSLYKNIPPGHWFFRIMNQMAWLTEIVASMLMIVPQTRFIGGAVIAVTFLYIMTQIRLGLLCEMVALCCVFYFYPGSLGDRALSMLMPTAAESGLPSFEVPPVANSVLSIALWAYLILLPFAHAGLFYNFYGRRSFPALIQRTLEAYTKFFGITIWRVFSVDIINFFILIHHQPRDGGDRSLISRYGHRGGLRYAHVAESITITCLFTTLKYYPSNSDLFQQRLLRYAKTIPHPDGSVLIFEYVSITKAESAFEHTTVAEYEVDIRSEIVNERIISEDISVHAADKTSPVFEGGKPGSYAPPEKTK